MKLTEATRKWLRENCSVAADANDEAYCAALSKALIEGKLTAAQLAEMQTTEDASAASKFEKMLSDQFAKMNERLAAIEQKAAAPTGAGTGTGAGAGTGSEGGGNAGGAPGSQKGGNGTEVKRSRFDKMFADTTAEPISIDPDAPLVARVKGANEWYRTTKTAAVYPDTNFNGRPHPLKGKPVMVENRPLETPSELDHAINGAFLKFSIQSQLGGKTPHGLRMTEHDRDLMQYALHECKWGGVLRGTGSEDEGAIAVRGAKLTDMMMKALIDDGTSGGLEVAPIAFDDAIIMTPLLSGEFFPLVNTVNVTRGRRMEGASIGNVTISSGGADATDIPLFNTASFIAAFDTTIHVVNGAIEIGLDFASDSPVDIASLVTAQYGVRLNAWLDEQVCIGDGSTEPEGIMVASGTTSVSFGSAAATIGKYESLLFGVPKRYKMGYTRDRIVFGANETTYARAKAVPISGSDDRRIFGMNHQDYMLLEHPYKISDAMANTQAFFANLARYRMYRRLGMTINVDTTGKSLRRANTMLLTMRARFGGQLEDGLAAAVTTTAQA